MLTIQGSTFLLCGVRHGAKVDKQPELVVCVEPWEVHFAGNFFGLNVLAHLLPQILRLDAVVVDLVGRAVHRDAHFGDVRVNAFFQVSGGGGVGLDKEQKNALECPPLRNHSDVDPAVRGFCKCHHFSHDMIV